METTDKQFDRAIHTELGGFYLDIIDRVQNLRWSLKEIALTLQMEPGFDLLEVICDVDKACSLLIESQHKIDPICFDGPAPKVKNKREAFQTRKAAIIALNDDLD